MDGLVSRLSYIFDSIQGFVAQSMIIVRQSRGESSHSTHWYSVVKFPRQHWLQNDIILGWLSPMIEDTAGPTPNFVVLETPYLRPNPISSRIHFHQHIVNLYAGEYSTHHRRLIGVSYCRLPETHVSKPQTLTPFLVTIVLPSFHLGE